MELHSYVKYKPMMQAMDFFYIYLNCHYPGTSNSVYVIPGQYMLSGKFHLSQLRKNPNLFVGEDLGCSHKLSLLQDSGWLLHMHLPLLKLFTKLKGLLIKSLTTKR